MSEDHTGLEMREGSHRAGDEGRSHRAGDEGGIARARNEGGIA